MRLSSVATSAGGWRCHHTPSFNRVQGFMISAPLQRKPCKQGSLNLEIARTDSTKSNIVMLLLLLCMRVDRCPRTRNLPSSCLFQESAHIYCCKFPKILCSCISNITPLTHHINSHSAILTVWKLCLLLLLVSVKNNRS